MPKKRIISFVILLMFAATLLSTLTSCTTSEKQIPIPSVKKDVYIYDQNNTIDDIEQNPNQMLVEHKEDDGEKSEKEVTTAGLIVMTIIIASIVLYSILSMFIDISDYSYSESSNKKDSSSSD